MKNQIKNYVLDPNHTCLEKTSIQNIKKHKKNTNKIKIENTP